MGHIEPYSWPYFDEMLRRGALKWLNYLAGSQLQTRGTDTHTAHHTAPTHLAAPPTLSQPAAQQRSTVQYSFYTVGMSWGVSVPCVVGSWVCVCRCVCVCGSRPPVQAAPRHVTRPLQRAQSQLRDAEFDVH